MYEAGGLKDARSQKDKPPPRVPSGAFVHAIQEALVQGKAGSHTPAEPAGETVPKFFSAGCRAGSLVGFYYIK